MRSSTTLIVLLGFVTLLAPNAQNQVSAIQLTSSFGNQTQQPALNLVETDAEKLSLKKLKRKARRAAKKAKAALKKMKVPDEVIEAIAKGDIGALKDLSEDAVKFVKDHANDLREELDDRIGDVKTILSKTPEAIADIARKTGNDDLADKLTGISNKIHDGIEDFEDLINKGSDEINDTLTVVESYASGKLDALNELSDDAKAYFDKHKDALDGLVEAYQLAGAEVDDALKTVLAAASGDKEALDSLDEEILSLIKEDKVGEAIKATVIASRNVREAVEDA